MVHGYILSLVLLALAIVSPYVSATRALASTILLNGRGPDISSAGLHAEGHGQWQQAISIYLDILLKTPDKTEIWLRIASIEHQLKNNTLALDAYKHASALQPNNPIIHKTLSEIYAELNHPLPALLEINEAVKFKPNDIDYLEARSKIANWNNKFEQAQDSYQRILAISPNNTLALQGMTFIEKILKKPKAIPIATSLRVINYKTKTLNNYAHILQLKSSDQNARLNMAHALAWQGHTDAAITAYERFLRTYPNVADGWILYAEALSWTDNYIGAFDALKHYKQLKGETTTYLKVKARILALSGRFKSSMAINSPLLHAQPTDSYILSTEISALVTANQLNRSLAYLKQLEQISQNDPQVKSLKEITITPYRSNINIETDYTAASDTTQIQDVPVSAQYFLSPTTAFLLQGLYERATAASTSGLEAVNGHDSIFDQSVKVGFATQIAALNLKGLVGGLKIQGKNNHGIYDAALNTNIGETAHISVESLHDLYRPYLIPQTPKLISLQIMETRVSTSLQWQPFIQKYLNVTMSHSDLSDNNSYTHVNIWPKSRIYGSEKWLATVGIDGDFWRYRRRAADGYYSPLKFNGYEGTLELYYTYSENIGVSLSGGFGAQKDELLPHYFYEEDLAMQVFLGIFTDWELKIGGGYTLRENPIKNYYCWSTGATLTRRF